jgi:hypothetical protein
MLVWYWGGDASALCISSPRSFFSPSLSPTPTPLPHLLVLFVTFVAVPQRNPHGTSSGLGGFFFLPPQRRGRERGGGGAPVGAGSPKVV